MKGCDAEGRATKGEKEKRTTGQEQGEGEGKGYIDRGRSRKEGEM